MTPQIRAVIDVGTNSVKLLVAEVAGHSVRPLHEEGRQTRLGRGFYETHQLQPGPISETARAVAAFAATARGLGAGVPRVIATSAARDATNAAELIAALAAASGLPLEVISGEQEADWAFRGVAGDPRFAAAALLLLDVGGGSSEFILGQGGRQHFRRSFPLGAVRCMEKLPHGDPPRPGELTACRAWLGDFLAGEVRPALGPALEEEERRIAAGARASSPACGSGRASAGEVADASVVSESKPDETARAPVAQLQLVGTGGTTTILARMARATASYDRDLIESTRFTLAEVRRWVERLWSLPLAERRKLVGLPPERADVMLYGVAIYEAVMECLGFGALRVSTRGLRFGALLDEAWPGAQPGLIPPANAGAASRAVGLPVS